MYQAHIFQHLVKTADIQQEFRYSIPFLHTCKEHTDFVTFLHFVKSPYADFLWNHFFRGPYKTKIQYSKHYLIISIKFFSITLLTLCIKNNNN